MTTWSLADLGLDPATVGLTGSATRVVHAAERPERPDRVLVTGDAETVPALVDYLSQKGFA